jgi:hypothetical protein
MEILDIIRSLGQKENTLTLRVFVSPVFNNDTVITLIDGLVHRLRLPKIMDPGWYKIHPIDLKKAFIVGPANLIDIEDYLRHLKKTRLVLLYKDKDCYQAIPLKNNNVGLNFSKPVPIYLVSDFVDSFDTVVCGFDGANFWYWENDSSNDPAKAEYLRDRFEKSAEPDTIRFKGLCLEEKLAYGLRYALDVKKREQTKEGMLKKDVEHAGGKFVKFAERKDHYSVTYKVDGQQYTSYVSKDTSHHVLTAGICLRGGDHKFDLASLVTVLREGQRRDLIHRYDNTEE